MEKKIIIGLTGKIACGKGTIKNYLMEKYEADDYRFSTILRDVAKRLDIETTRQNLQTMSQALRQAFGEDTLAKAMIRDLQNSQAKLIVVDGIRRMQDIIFLREMEGFKLWQVIAAEDIRYKRVVSRNENPGDAEKTLEEFLQDEKGEAEKEIPNVMSHSDYTIDNETTIPEMHLRIDAVMEDIELRHSL